MDDSLNTLTSKKEKIMQRRLSMWDRFFEKTQEKYQSIEDSGDEVFEDQDPMYIAVNEEHNRLRKSIIEENGICEESSNTSCDTEQAHNNVWSVRSQNARKGKNFKITVKPFMKKKTPAKRNQTGRKIVRPKEKETETLQIFKKQTAGAPAVHKSKRVEELIKSPNQNRQEALASQHNSSIVNVLKATKSFKKDTQISSSSGNEVTESRFAKKVHSKSNRNNPESSASKKSCEETVPKNTKRSSSNVQVYSRNDYSKFYEHYELWKNYEKIKSGSSSGSVYIVSDLYKEPTEADRCVLNFPAVVKKPILEPPRFILKAPTRSR